MQVIEKAFGYITRTHEDQLQVLVFEQNPDFLLYFKACFSLI